MLSSHATLVRVTAAQPAALTELCWLHVFALELVLLSIRVDCSCLMQNPGTQATCITTASLTGVDNAGLIAFRTSLSSGNAATADLEAMGDIIKGARHYVAGLLWFASSGAGIVLIKVGTAVLACSPVVQ